MVKSKIQAIRKRAGISSKEAMEKLKISSSFFYKIEQGVKLPGRQLIVDMSKLYNCSIEEIFLALNATDSDIDSKIV